MPGPRHLIEGVTYPSLERAAPSLASGAWIDSTVGDALRATTRLMPDRAAFISDERTLTFRDFDESTDRLGAALLSIGLCPGDRAIFQLGTTVETAIALLACFKAGVVPVCSLPQHRSVEIGQLTRQAGAKAYFVQADFGSNFDMVGFANSMVEAHPSLKHLIVVRGEAAAGGYSLQSLIESMPLSTAHDRLADIVVASEDVLSFQLSGGTTGMPKIIPRFHAEYLGHSSALMHHYRMDVDSRVIWSLPLLHNAGQLYSLIPTVLRGVTSVLMARVDIRHMLPLIERHRVTHALSIGPIAPQLLTYPDVEKHDLSSLQLFATMNRADALEARLKVPCSNLFGITEGLLLGAPADAPAFVRHHTQGWSSCASDAIRLLAPESETLVEPGQSGELCIKGPSTLTGYFDNAQANAEAFTSDGYYRTGDMMIERVVDGITCYSFEGRLRDNVNRGGEKIGCEEVEAFVCRHPAVTDAKLVAMPDPHYGEKGCIYIIPRPGATAPDVQSLARFLVEQGLAKYKCPERIETIDSFPVTRVGKLDKPAMRRWIAEKISTEKALAQGEKS